MVFELGKIDWIAVSAIVAMLGVCATVVMIFYTRKSLKANEKQLDEIKRQWEEENKPCLVLDFIFHYGYVCLKLENVGNRPINNLSIGINKDFLDISMFETWKNAKTRLLGLKNKKLTISPKSYKLLLIGAEIATLETEWVEPLVLNIYYDGQPEYSQTIDVPTSIATEISRYDKLYFEEIVKIRENIGKIENKIKK